MIAGKSPTIPAPALALFGLALGAAVWTYFLVFQEMSRALVGGFGSPAPEVVLACVGTLAGSLPLLALLPIALLPRWWYGHRLPARRLAAGRCPDCDYPAHTFPCPECGGDGVVAPIDLFARRPLIGVLAIGALLYAGGVVQAEWRLRRDEALFREQVQVMVSAGDLREFRRVRAGWGSFAVLHYDPATGFDAPPPFDHPRIPGWRAAGRPAP